MTAAILDLNGERMIEQGSYWEITLLYPGNITGAFLKSEIKKGYSNAEDVTAFRFGQLEYDEDSNKTSIPMYLNSIQTRGIAIPPETPGYWRYDVLLTLPGKDAIRLIQGRVYVSPGVTD